MATPTTPVPRRKVTIAAAASSPSPQTNGTKAKSRTALGSAPLASKPSPSVTDTASSSAAMRTGMNSRSNATEPACTVVGDVGVTSTASSVPIICSWRIAVATRWSSSPVTVAITTPIMTNSK
jgi:hypothetical protein